MARDDPTVRSDVLLTERIGNVLVLTLNRPEVRNALNPELKRGLFAAGGGTTLSARIPLAVALEFGLTGEFMSAQRAREIGLFNKVVPAADVKQEALALAAKIADNAPLSVAITKKLMRERRWGTDEETSAVFRSGDAMEGARAFAERRTPVWTGK